MEPILSSFSAWVIVIGFGVLWLLLGLYWGRGVKTSEDFMVAGRNVGLSMGSATVIATWCTASTVLAAPELGFRAGLWALVGYGLGGLGVIFFGPVAQRIKKLMPSGVTSGDFMRVRYGESTWTLYMIIASIYNLAFLVTQAMGGGLLLDLVFGIPYHVGMILITTVCVLYTMAGGMKAVVGTDFIQSIMIMASVVIVIAIAISKIGFGTMYTGILQNVPERLDALAPLGLMYAFNSAIFSLGEIFHSNLWWVRAHSMRDDVVRKGWKYGGLMWMSIPVLAGSAGLIFISAGLETPHMNMIFPIVAVEFLGTFGAFLITLIVLGAIYSTLDSLLAGVSSLIAEDIYHAKINPNASDAQLKKVNRHLVWILGLITIAFAWFQPATMGQMIFFTAAMVCTIIWPVIFGLFSDKPSTSAAISSILIGSAAGLFTAIKISTFGAAIAAAIVSLPVFLIVTKMSNNKFDWNKFNKMPLPNKTQFAGNSGQTEEV